MNYLNSKEIIWPLQDVLALEIDKICLQKFKIDEIFLEAFWNFTLTDDLFR